MSRNVIFDESTFWQWNDATEANQNPNQFTVEYLVTEPREEGMQHQEPSAATPPEPVEFATPRTANLMLDANHNDGLVARYWRIEDLLGGGEPPELAARELKFEFKQ